MYLSGWFCLSCIFEIFKYKYGVGDCGLRVKSLIKVFHLRTVQRSKDNCGKLWAVGLVILQCTLFWLSYIQENSNNNSLVTQSSCVKLCVSTKHLYDKYYFLSLFYWGKKIENLTEITIISGSARIWTQAIWLPSLC